MRSIVIWLLLLVSGAVMAPDEAFGEQPDAGDTSSNRLMGIKGFPLDYDSGSMALHALHSCLESYYWHRSYDRLVGISGAAFKFVYDSTEAYEPLRDLSPTDLLQTASARLGFHQARWEVNQPIEAVRRLIKHEIDVGHPVIAPFLKFDAYHGFFIVTGYDYGKDIIYLQGAFGESTEVSVPVPDGWDGPTVSVTGWSTNPIFVMGAAFERRSDSLWTERAVFEEAIRLLRGGDHLIYGLHPGERIYMGEAGPHEARFGIPAYGLLSYDVETEDLVSEHAGEMHLNFGFVWRIDAQVGQLEHDRRNGALFLGRLGTRFPEEHLDLLMRLMHNVELTAQNARALRKVFWHEIPDTLVSGETILEYVKTSESMVFRLPDRDDLRDQLRIKGQHVFRSPWGFVLVDDTHHKRIAAKVIVKSILSRERTSLRMLEEIVEHVDGPRPRHRPLGGGRFRKSR